MKISCDVIKDLLILYEDDVCSMESRKAVEDHLKECTECSNYFRKLQSTDAVIAEEIKEQFVAEDTTFHKGLKKIRRRWLISVLAVFMLIPVMMLGVMGYHEKHREGIAFSNLDDIYRCMRYLRYIEEKEFEKAVEMVDFSEDSYKLVTSVADMSVEQYQEYMKERMLQKLREYDALGIYIDNITYNSAYRRLDGIWNIRVSFTEHYPDGSEQKIAAHLGGETLYAGAFDYPYQSSVDMDDYIDEILHLYSEDAPLEYQNFEVTFELKEGEKVVIDLKKAAAYLKENKGIVLEKDSVGVFNISYGTGTPLMKQGISKETFVISVPGKYSICRSVGWKKNEYFTVEDLGIEIIK